MPFVKSQLRAASIDVDRPDDSDIDDDVTNKDGDGDDVNRKRCIGRFVTNYLRRDGLLLVRLVATNVSQLAAGQLLSALWTRHGGRPDKLPLRQRMAARRRKGIGVVKKTSRSKSGLQSGAGGGEGCGSTGTHDEHMRVSLSNKDQKKYSGIMARNDSG